VIRSCECVCVPARKAFPGAVRKINQNRFKSTTSVADLPMSVCVCECVRVFAIGLVGVCIVKMLPIYLFLCPRVCFIASAFVAVIVALLPSSESISHFPHFTHFHPIPQKKGESLCMRPSSAFTHIFGQFSITELRHKHPHITPTHISRH